MIFQKNVLIIEALPLVLLIIFMVMILKLCMKTDLSRKNKMTFLNAERKELLSQVEL